MTGFKVKNLMAIVGILLCFATHSFANEEGFLEDQPLLDKILVEGVKQRFFKVQVRTLASTIRSFAETPNSWDRPATFKIFNKEGENFAFEGIKSGSYSEPPMCEDYEIHFRGTFNKEQKDFQWQLGIIEIKYLNRIQCL